jgi:electron transfer flavoprotein beta subunit
VKLELGEGTFKAEREVEGGSELVEGALPAVITAQKGLNEPRYASLKGIMAAKKKTIEEVDAVPATVGTQTIALALPPERAAGRKLEGDAAAQAQALIQTLKDEAKVF